MQIVAGAQPIHAYGPPTGLVWTTGEPCTESDCLALMGALSRGEIEIIERGRWGSYNVILRWSATDGDARYVLAELHDTPADPS